MSTVVYVTFQGLLVLALLGAVCFIVFMSVHLIGSDEIGLVNKRFSFKKLPGDNPIAFRGEAGYQAALLMPGWRWKIWPIFSVEVIPGFRSPPDRSVWSSPRWVRRCRSARSPPS